MTIQPADLPAKVAQARNDIDEIDGLLGKVESTQRQHSGRLLRIENKLLDHDARFDAVDARLTEIIERPRSLMSTAEEPLRPVLSSRLPEGYELDLVYESISTVNGRTRRFENRFDEIFRDLDDLRAELTAVHSQLDRIEHLLREGAHRPGQ